MDIGQAGSQKIHCRGSDKPGDKACGRALIYIQRRADQLGRRSILAISLAFSALAVLAITLVPPGIPLMVSVGLLGFFHYSLRPIIFAYALDVAPPEIGATTISFVFTWNQILSAISPLLGGLLADAYGIQF
jgi:MFS family permease